MREYIINLTNNLIGKNRYYEMFRRIKTPEEFIKFVKTDLFVDDVRAMSPAKLGEIMCSFESGEIAISKNDLFDSAHFCGDCEEILRELVSFCLAHIIMGRLDGIRPVMMPQWVASHSR